MAEIPHAIRVRNFRDHGIGCDHAAGRGGAGAGGAGAGGAGAGGAGAGGAGAGGAGAGGGAEPVRYL